jgi:hypothetical protein
LYGFITSEPDKRPGCLFDDVDGIDMRDVTVQRTENSSSVVQKKSANFTIVQSKGIED